MSKKSIIPFNLKSIDRSAYEEACRKCGMSSWTDDECDDLYLSYTLAKHGKSSAIKLAFLRGYTINNFADQKAFF